MRKLVFAAAVLTVFVFAANAQPAPSTTDYVRIEPNDRSGFTYPYYLYIPPELKTDDAKKHTQTLLVLPNNTGSPNDSFEFHEADVKRRMTQVKPIASDLKVAVLMPVFPRPRADWKIYTQALDRDSMVTDKKEYRRLDVQLVAMIDDARKRAKIDGTKLDKKVLINGFSAQGMFANRFTFLHPDRVKAAAIGSPGGWPIAPVAKYKDKELRYPIGVADLELVAGHGLDMKKLRTVPLFLFIGDKDENDSVPFDDSYDQQDRDLMNPLLGKTPVERWPVSVQIYKDAGLSATFRIYPGVAHTVNAEMRNDIRAFLLKYAH